ncbi:MAG: hypothetical protein H0W89_04525 [Candidatus Levybacteria bacterium]|nr:hypothetical protein [Candidatus Levybacteria bacterium]
MDENDKPIGAPTIHNETSAESQIQTPQKPKHKLNWKAFGIGIIAVIIIEVLAVSMLQSGDPQIPIAPPQDEPLPTKTASASAIPTTEQVIQVEPTIAASPQPTI